MVQGAAGAGMKTTVGGIGWTYVTLKDDLPAETFFFGQKAVTLPKGTLIRYYEGSSDFIEGGKKKRLTTPAPDGSYLIETTPDKKSRFWMAYPDEPKYITLLESKEYEETEPERIKHLFTAKLPIKEAWWSNQIIDNILHLQLDGLALEEQPKQEGGGGGGGGDAEKEGDGFPWLAVGLGVGLAALIAMLVGKDDKKGKGKGKGKRGRRRRAARRRARRVRRVT